MRSRSAIGSRDERDAMYVGERWSIVTCAASFASAGTNVTAVAPLPITTTRLPRQSKSAGHFLRMDDRAGEMLRHPRSARRVSALVTIVARA